MTPAEVIAAKFSKYDNDTIDYVIGDFKRRNKIFKLSDIVAKEIIAGFELAKNT